MLIFKLSAGMRSDTSIPAMIIAGLIFLQPITSQSRPGVQMYPELVPLPFSAQLSTIREPLPVETIVDAALEFSGASEASASAAKDKLVGLLRRFRDEVTNVTEQAALGEKALIFLHRNLLTTYAVLQTRVDTALDTGVFNCVSSAVLYLIIARSVGLSVSGVRTTDHAFCAVLVNGQQVDVETTNPDGFNPGAKKEFTDSFGKTTGFRYVPPGNYADRRAIGGIHAGGYRLAGVQPSRRGAHRRRGEVGGREEDRLPCDHALPSGSRRRRSPACGKTAHPQFCGPGRQYGNRQAG